MNSDSTTSPLAERDDEYADGEISRLNGTDPVNSKFDYIIVGSGAGGGPLAARLTLAGKKVLVIEAGRDPAHIQEPPNPPRFDPGVGEVTKAPGYYAAASEDPKMSWMFSVRHHEVDAQQTKDAKYNAIPTDPTTGAPLDKKFLDPHPRGGKQGIFYPRSSGIGGCTAHHAMITIAPNEKDWNYIADLTGDASWRPGPMRGYFAKFERCQYIDDYDRFFKMILGGIYKFYRKLILLLDPRAILDNGGHGLKGWAPTNLIDPFLVETIAKTDHSLLRAIGTAAIAVLRGNWGLIARLKHQLIESRIVPAIDFNDINTRRAQPEGVFLIPIGTAGKGTLDEEKKDANGRRFGVREFLLSARRQHPDRLIIRQGAHATRILFKKTKDDEPPRAIGVECAIGDRLYEASPRQNRAAKERVRYFAKEGGEIILCGGAFNTPQLLMLSGIGNTEHLAAHGITHLFGADGKPLKWRADEGKKPLPVATIHLPGVGRNLQDRYEVTVVSELDKDLTTLDTVSFEPGDTKDKERTKWVGNKTGLYTSNGGTLAVIRRSKPAEEAGDPDPDLFTFGAPAAFRGYYWNWSHELFKATLGAPTEKRRLWSWVILKAYTHNHHGSVRLRSDSPFDMPEVCFDVFNEQAEKDRAVLKAQWSALQARCDALTQAGDGLTDALETERTHLQEQLAASDTILAESKRDLDALVDAVKFMRKVNARNPSQFVREIQPGEQILDDSDELKQWIKTQTWGHHASCTCRMGSDKWQKNAKDLIDREAVLDSRFRVHGVAGLRVVDASVFPRIPGYFILAPIFMISEKAADTLLEDAVAAVYPESFRAEEIAAVIERRKKAFPFPINPGEVVAGVPVPAGPREREPGRTRLPERTVGLALSGGGIRSATFALGVLQSLAKFNRLRDVDLLSTVSGGGFIGSFLGRLYTRDSVKRSHDPCGRVQDILANDGSAPIWWLRTQANYIFATGQSDVRLNLAVFWRNIFTVHLVVGTLLFMVFGLLAWLPQGVGLLSDWLGLFRPRAIVEPLLAPPVIEGIALSAWWWLPALALALAVIPSQLGYWLAPKVGSYRPYPFYSLLAWLVLLIGALITLGVPNALPYSGGLAVILLLSWTWQEVARWGALKGRETEAALRQVGTVVRNRVSRSLGEALFIFAALIGWVVLDTLAALVAAQGLAKALALVMAACAPLLPFLQKIAMGAKQQVSLDGKGKGGFSLQKTAAVVGIPLAIFLLWVVDVEAHQLINSFPGWSWGVAIVAIIGAFCLAVGRAFDFLNLSSLHSTYAARVTRTFQGASNEARVYAPASDDGRDVKSAHPGDDIPHDEYHPEKTGGPLHLINVCVNETVDLSSGREIRERKGLPMCVTPHGVSVGRRYFARWSAPDKLPRWQAFRRWLDGLDGDDAQPYTFWWTRLLRRWRKKPAPVRANKAALTALQALPVASDPNAFHVLATTRSESAEVESLTLGGWTAVSGAAFSTGIGRGTNLPLSLFMGLANVRLGYWWDSGIRSEERPGRYPLPLWRRIKRLPVTFFRMQSLLLGEWRGLFNGASQWFWYLSDGGHFEVTGLYELVRRRVPFMIVSEAGEDPKYQWGDVALLTEQVREDFGAELEWLSPATDSNKQRLKGWAAFPDISPIAYPTAYDWIKDWIEPDQIGFQQEIHREGKYHAALGKVTYPDGEVSWVLLFKPGLNEGLTDDIINYGKVNTDFPQQPTFDQVFDDEQWESYRALGQQIARNVLKKTP